MRAFAAAVGLAVCAGASAQTFPTRPVRMVVHIGPGSSMDIVARVLAQKMNEAWGQPVIVDNRGGAGGTLGMDVVAKAVPDGYTILFGSSSVAIAASYYRKLPFDALRDLEPLTQISSRHNALVVSPSSAVNSVKDLIALAKAKPGEVSYGSGGGNGSSDHLAGELFALMAGVKLLHVPYKSGPAAQNDLMSGALSFYLGGIPVNLPMIRAGKVRALATSGLKRSPQLPNVPTIAESGVPGFEVNVWYGLFGPRGMPPRIVDKIAADVGKILAVPETRERFSALGVEAEGGDAAKFKTYYRNDLDKWRKVVKAAHVSDGS
ncbi:MAG TPA: tripartite tricarboxylate transporter substrate binding protein [Burkholderiales bacterium]|nr:tripartite tricarboxylate transporter substrate binding protein [Burkholderiales bacterium]